jgi:Fe-S cluster biogenesis protein NfuA
METSLRQRVDRIEGLIQQINSAPDLNLRGAAVEVIQTLMEVHYNGLDRLMEIVAEGQAAGWPLMEDFARDEAVTSMLLLHGLHPIDLEERVASALDKVRPYLHSHGGNVELVEIADGIVRLRLVGSCDGCPSSAITMKTAIEKAIHDAAPDVVSIETK